MSWTREQFLERAAFIEVQIAKWRGAPDYAETLRMELFALRLAAEHAGDGRQKPIDATVYVD